MITISEKAQGLIFDLDGTLVNTIRTHFDAWQEACRKYGFGFSLPYFFKLTGRPVLELAEQIIADHNVTVNPNILVEEKELLFQNNIHKIAPILPIIKLVKDYHGKLPMTVGTGSSKEMAHKILGISELNGYFNKVVNSDDITNPKPHPETFIKCANAMGIAPKYCQVFEDGHLGLQAAKNAGMIVTDVKPFYTENIWGN